MIDELTDDLTFPYAQQQGLISTYCPGVAEYILTAPNREDAEAYAREQCARFDRECESTILRTFLKGYVQHLLARRRENGG